MHSEFKSALSFVLIAHLLVNLCQCSTLSILPPGSCICTLEYAPVCCRTKSGVVQTSGNSCSCECIGTVLFRGTCDDPMNQCRMMYSPVCCKLPNGTIKTLDNSCECNRAHGKIISEGKCRDPASCLCPAIFNPVCCKLPDGTLTTKSNECLCRCENGSATSAVKCPTVTPSPTSTPSPSPSPPPCFCTKEYMPVCCKSSTGLTFTAGNACECSGCDSGGSILYKGKCFKQCICTHVYDPVCCLHGKTISKASNGCECGCRGGTVVKYGCSILETH